MESRENRWLNLRWPNSCLSFIGDRPLCSNSKSFSSPLIQYTQEEGQMWKTRIQKRCERWERGNWVKENEQERRATEAGIGALQSSAYAASAMIWHVKPRVCTFLHFNVCTALRSMMLSPYVRPGSWLASLCRASHPKHCPALGHRWPLGHIH